VDNPDIKRKKKQLMNSDNITRKQLMIQLWTFVIKTSDWKRYSKRPYCSESKNEGRVFSRFRNQRVRSRHADAGT